MPGRILITGANGYLGAQCIERCALSNAFDVVAVWHSATDRLLARPPAHIRYEQCDLTDPAAVDGLIRRSRVDVILHTAALLPETTAGYTRRAVLSNVLATANLSESAALLGC